MANISVDEFDYATSISPFNSDTHSLAYRNAMFNQPSMKCKCAFPSHPRNRSTENNRSVYNTGYEEKCSAQSVHYLYEERAQLIVYRARAFILLKFPRDSDSFRDESMDKRLLTEMKQKKIENK